MTGERESIEIFCCYAHEDKDLLLVLKSHLALLKRLRSVKFWHDADISPGMDWENEVHQRLNTAKIILLLVSPDFMDSDYCYSIELQRAMERQQRGEVVVIPIILRPVYWKDAPFGRLEALPTKARPVTGATWHNLDEAFFDVAEGIRKVVEVLMLSSSTPTLSQKHRENVSITKKENETRILKPSLTKQDISRTQRQSGVWRNSSQQHSIPPTSYFSKLIQKNTTSIFGLLILILGSSIGFIYIRPYVHMNAPRGTTGTNSQSQVFAVPNNWKMTMDDHLSNNNRGYHWDEIPSACVFEQGAYHVIATEGFFRECHSLNTDFDNFAVQVQMTIMKGECGGIMFRVTGSFPGDKFYKLEMCQNAPTLGANLTRYASDDGTDSTFLPSHLSSENTIEINLGRPIALAIIASKSLINIYFNQKLVYSADDNTYIHGRIALIAKSYNQTAEVVYSNIKVWTP